MRIAFEAAPLVGDVITGVGNCEAALTEALARLHPENRYRFEYFSLRTGQVKLKRLEPFLHGVITPRPARFSPLVYRAATAFIPIPYKAFFGDWADITHFFNYIVPPGVSGKTVVTVHDMVVRAYPETMNRRTRDMLRLCLEKSMRRADAIVTDSAFSESEILKYYPSCAGKITVIPCAADTRRFHPVTDEAALRGAQNRLGIEGEYFLYLGTLEPRKNLTRLLKAYALLRDRLHDVPKLVLAGSKGWQTDSIFETVKKYHLTDDVLFPSFVPAQDLPALYSGAEAFLFPSLYEGFGLPPLEAMACGTPVLVSQTGALKEVCGNAAVRVNPYKPEAIALGMERILTDSALRKRLSMMGRARALSFSWDRSAQKLYALYTKMLKADFV